MDKSGWCCLNRSVKGQPSLETNRLALRPLMVKDAPTVRELTNNRKIADMCVCVPREAGADGAAARRVGAAVKIQSNHRSTQIDTDKNYPEPAFSR
jgi:hypothetical protein